MEQNEDAVDRLLALAAEALRTDSSLEEQLSAIEDYCQEFSRIESELSGQRLEELSRKHAAVLDKVKRLFAGAALDMKSFQRKARGIMAYVDTLPKKISVTKNKKG
jgi:hypothetical protein